MLAGTLTWTPQTVQRQVDLAKESADKLTLLTRTGPTVLWIVGALLLIVGLLLLLLQARRNGGAVRRHRGPQPQTKPEQVPA